MFWPFIVCITKFTEKTILPQKFLMTWQNATDVTNSKLLIKLIDGYCLGTTATLTAAAYTNAAATSGTASTYSPTNAVTYACNTGYASTASSLTITCTTPSGGGDPDWVRAPTDQNTCTGKKFCAMFLQFFHYLDLPYLHQVVTSKVNWCHKKQRSKMQKNSAKSHPNVSVKWFSSCDCYDLH